MNPELGHLFLPFFLFVVVTSLLLFLRGIAFRLLHPLVTRAGTKIGDIVIGAFRTPSFYWCIAIGLYVGIAVSDMPDRYAFYLNKTIHVIVIFSITIATAHLTGKVFRDYVQTASFPLPATGLAYALLKGTIILIGILIILSSLGISIAPLITALGVGGLAVALALKDTLENLFAGIHILAEKKIRVGDIIRLEAGQEGMIEDISWRTTRLRLLNDNLLVIPNSKLSQSIVINYALPDSGMMLSIPFPVKYGADTERAEAIVLAEAVKGIGEIPGLLADPEPATQLMPAAGGTLLEVTLVCRIRTFGDQFRVQHELRRRILKRFRDEGIPMP
ncbi:MAG: mechanosensitive ion channel domain-containing protein [Nitrospirota bacterium]